MIKKISSYIVRPHRFLSVILRIFNLFLGVHII